MAKEIKRIEDIYPLTIVRMRYGGKFVILNADVDSGEGVLEETPSWADYLQGYEEAMYHTDEWLENTVAPCLYGIGESLELAFEDYKKRLK